MRNRRASSARMRGWLAAAGLLIWIIAPLSLVIVLTVRSGTSPLHVPSEVLVSVEQASGELRRPIAIELQWAPATDVIAPAWSGVVGNILAPAGASVTDGTPLAVVDGITRVAVASTMPFYRPLNQNASGPDVKSLNTFLRSQNFAAPESEVFNRQTLLAVRAFAASIGVPDANQISAFSPDWVIYLPGEGIISAPTLLVSAPAPAPGEPIFTLAPALIGAALVSSSSADSAPPDSEDRAALSEPPVPSEIAATGETLAIGETELDLDESRQFVSLEDLAGLAAEVSGEPRYTSAVLSLKLNEGQWLVPSPAVIIDASGAACVEIAKENRREIVAVTPLATIDGRIAIAGELDASSQVAIYPPNVRVSCRSS